VKARIRKAVISTYNIGGRHLTLVRHQQGANVHDSGAARRLHLVPGDTTFATEAVAALQAALPDGWVLGDQPEGATLILAVDAPIEDELIKRAGPSLRLIATTIPDDLPSGFDDVQVVRLPTEGQQGHHVVAEYAVTMILALARNLLALARTAIEDPWAPGRDEPALTTQAKYVYNWTQLQSSGYLFDKVVGIIGVGAIGSSVAQMLAPFGARLLYTQRSRLPAADERQLHLEWRDFDDLIQESDFITLHHRLQEGPGGNEGQFSAREFAMMKNSAFLVNTSRGRILDEDALIAALREGQIAGAALDVFHYEPLPKDHPLLALAGDNVIITPHLAAGSERAYWTRVLRIALEAYAGPRSDVLLDD
jgi:phosphoglycerate dehydrogenase-like enzyme